MSVNLQAKFPGFDIKSQEKLANYTNTQVGGPAEWAFWPYHVQELMDVLEFVHSENLPITVLGNASNLVIGDAGLKGVTIFLSHLNQIEVTGQAIKAGAGAAFIDITQAALEASLTGIEWAAGIPGSVGGAVYMNAGAYGGESADWISSITVLTPENEIKVYQQAELEFGYRHSLIQTTGDIILDATFQLAPGEFKAIEMMMEDFNTRRALRQPLEYPSCGSTFKRPEGHYAGRLIMDAGLQGFTIGGAQVSTKHAGFIVNVNQATSADYIGVIHQVQKIVAQKFDVQLETEVRILN